MNTTTLWKAVLSELELAVTKPTFATFFASSQLLSFEKGVATIGCANAVAVSLMETRYYALVKSLVDKHAKQETSLVFKVAPAKSAPVSHETDGPLFSPQQQTVPTTMSHETVVRAARLRPDFVFDTFAVSSTNQMAYAAATAVAASPGSSYNPLFFYGGVGVGKTHLMQAVGNQVLQKNPSTRVIFCMGEEFTNEIIDAIQTKTTKRFKDKFRSAQILLIDDVQFLEGKIKVQEEFFHTFNAVQRAGGQIVLTSDRPPHEIDRLEERLQSRFEGGLLVDMQNPDFELRCAILRIKAQQKGVDLPIPLAQILAASTDSVRRSEGLLTSLIGEMRFKKIPLTEELVRAVVGKPQLEESQSKRSSTPKQITEVVVKRFGVPWTQLKGVKRNRSIARPRQVLMFLLRTELGLPLDEVGSWVGGRDHTTVLHAVDTITHLLSTNETLREDISWIKKELFG